MSGYDCGYVLRDGTLVGADSHAEVKEWHQRHPNPDLLVSAVLGVEVTTAFTGWLYGTLGSTARCSPFESFVLDHPMHGRLGSDHWEGALHAHEEMVSFVIHRWFCTSSKEVVVGGALSGQTRITDVATSNGCLLPAPVTSARSIPGASHQSPHGLRWRLLNGLREIGAANWFEINRMLVTTPEKCLSVMSAAWADGILVRTDPEDRWAPPTFLLNDAGNERLRRGDFSITSSVPGGMVDDKWEPGWEPWMQHGCPVCGGFLGKTGGGNLICVADACQPGQAFDERHYEAVLENGELVEATARKGAREYYVSYAESRHEKRGDGKILRAAPGIPSAQRIRDYVRSAFV